MRCEVDCPIVLPPVFAAPSGAAVAAAAAAVACTLGERRNAKKRIRLYICTTRRLLLYGNKASSLFFLSLACLLAISCPHTVVQIAKASLSNVARGNKAHDFTLIKKSVPFLYLFFVYAGMFVLKLVIQRSFTYTVNIPTSHTTYLPTYLPTHNSCNKEKIKMPDHPLDGSKCRRPLRKGGDSGKKRLSLYGPFHKCKSNSKNKSSMHFSRLGCYFVVRV